MNNKFLNNRVFLTIVISVLIALIIAFLQFFNFSLINESINWYIVKYRNQKLIDNYWEWKVLGDDIVVIGIDEKTLSELGSYPFSRKEYVSIIESLSQTGSKAEIIGFDIMFANENQDINWDNEFTKAIEKAGNIVLWWAIINENNKEMIEEPLPKFLSWAINLWYYQMDIDFTKIVSFIPSKKLYNKKSGELKYYDYFWVAILKAYFSKIYNEDFINYQDETQDFYYLTPRSGYRVPFAHTWKREILINFLPFQQNKERFKNYSFIDVYNKNMDMSVFDWKIVIIWVTAKWIKDIFYTPNWNEYWVYVVANIINTLLTKNFIIFFNPTLELLLIFLLILLSVYFNLSRSSYVLIFSNISIFLIFIIIFPSFVLFWNFEPSYLLNYLFELILALILSLTISNIVKYLIENKDKNKLDKALSEYVSKAIAEEIISSKWTINLDWEVKRIAMYFSDIEWFTSVSEKMQAEELIKFLREFLSEMSDIILDEKWFINKYEWDAIMALWWVFIDDEKSSYSSCLVALKQQNLLKDLNEKWQKEWIPKIKVRIWLHVWEAIVWNIGSKGRKMEFTALWDNVNLASRLEWVNKFYRTYMCVSEDIYNENKEKFEFRYLDTIRVKWKDNPVKIYELLAFKWELSKEKRQVLKKFSEAIELYKIRDFVSAKTMFEELVKLWDEPSNTYLERCKVYIKKGPKATWDGVWDFEEK